MCSSWEEIPNDEDDNKRQQSVASNLKAIRQFTQYLKINTIFIAYITSPKRRTENIPSVEENSTHECQCVHIVSCAAGDSNLTLKYIKVKCSMVKM